MSTKVRHFPKNNDDGVEWQGRRHYCRWTPV